MTPVLSILCAVLVAVIAWQRLSLRTARSSLRTARARGEAIAANAAEERSKAHQRAKTDAALLAEAYDLLHDTAARGKDGRWLPWSERRAAWDKKCEVRG